VLSSHGDLLHSRIQIQECGADVVINLSTYIFRLSTALPQCGVCLRYVTLDLPSGEQGDADPRLKRKDPLRLSEGGAYDAIVAARGCDRIALRLCGRESTLRSLLRRASSEEVAPGCECRSQCFVDGRRSDLTVWDCICDLKSLSQRQSDRVAQVQFRNRQVVAGHNQVVLLGVKLHLGPGHIDAGSGASLEPPQRLVVR